MRQIVWLIGTLGLFFGGGWIEVAIPKTPMEERGFIRVELKGILEWHSETDAQLIVDGNVSPGKVYPVDTRKLTGWTPPELPLLTGREVILTGTLEKRMKKTDQGEEVQDLAVIGTTIKVVKEGK